MFYKKTYFWSKKSMMQLKKDFLKILIFLLFSTILYILFVTELINPTIIPLMQDDITYLFADWSVILNANICQEIGYDVYLDNPCDLWHRKHVYGEILLEIPFIQNFPNFYYIYFPLFLNLLFLYSIISFFNFKNKIENLSLIFFVFNVPVIFAMERANIDILIFLSVILISNNRNIFMNYFVLILTTISKFYPISMVAIFLFKKKLKKAIINIVIFSLIIFVILFLQSESLIKIFNNKSQFSGFGIYNFSFKGGLDFLLNLNISINNKDYNFIKYLYISLLLILPFILSILIYSKGFFGNNSISRLFKDNNFENRLFILSSALILFCYFSFSNFSYREIFLLGLIPWLLNNRHFIKNRFINLLFYILLSKFFISSFFTFLVIRNNFPGLNNLIILTKYCLDFYLVTMILVIFVGGLKSNFKYFVLQLDKKN